MTADRKPSLISWSEQFQADVALVDDNFRYAGRKLVGLLNRPFERYSTFNVKRGEDVDMEPLSPFKRAQIEMTASAIEVASAPDNMQRLFLDLGVQDGDKIAVELMIAKRDWKADPQRYAERVYSVTLVPTTYRPNLVGVDFNYVHQLDFLKSGTPVDKTESADLWFGSKRIREMGKVYHLLNNGMVYDSFEEGTHASITRYRQKPHPFIAAIHRGAADWIINLVENRMAK